MKVLKQPPPFAPDYEDGGEDILENVTTIDSSPTTVPRARAVVLRIYYESRSIPLRLPCPNCSRRTFPFTQEDGFSPVAGTAICTVDLVAMEFRLRTGIHGRDRTGYRWHGECYDCGCIYTIYEGVKMLTDRMMRDFNYHNQRKADK